MPNSGSILPFSLAPLLLPPLLRVPAPFGSALERWAIPDKLLETVREAEQSGRGAQFAGRLLEQLEIRFSVAPKDLAHIPSTGAAVLAANHPHGIVEGLILVVLLNSIRPDFKLVANSLLSRIDGMREHTILVNPFGTTDAHIENRAPLRNCVRLLANSGLLAMFPAGEVAHLNWTERAVTEPSWNTAAARLAIRARAAVIPVFFEGSNSLQFHLAGALHPGLRTIGLLRELMNLRGKTVQVRIGSKVSWDLLSQYATPASATEYLRSRTLFLANRPWAATPHTQLSTPRRQPLTVRPAGSVQLISAEVALLLPGAELARSDEFSVVAARAQEIPYLLAEIGRRREETFREVGEGTGKESDLDCFDEHYWHLFLWSRRNCQLAGAYRMALTQDILGSFGSRGLYTNTLFHYNPEFFERVGPALELGRSFVCRRYQKSYSPLLLLWKGIARFVLQHPEAPVLFGAVSISREYLAASRGLIARYLSDRVLRDLAPLVRPRKKWREPAAGAHAIKRLAGVAASIEDISLSISDIEEDGKGIPVLIRQYLKAGGKLVAFNVDPNFSDSVDALILTDLRTAPLSILERCMGRPGAKAFMEWHTQTTVQPDKSQDTSTGR